MEAAMRVSTAWGPIAPLAILLCSLPMPAVLAQWEPQGDAFLVNARTTGNQNWPAVTRSGDGAFRVVWVDASEGIRARTFDASGAGGGPEIQISDTNSPSAPIAAAGESGDFVVVWRNRDTSLQARPFY